jgi:hypothetical protein
MIVDAGDDGDKLMTTIPWIVNDRKKLSIGEETKSESLKEYLMQNTEGRRDDAERC